MLYRKASFQIRAACEWRVFSKAKILHLYEHIHTHFYEHRAHTGSGLLS